MFSSPGQGATDPSVPKDQQETQLPANPVGASLPAAASPEPQQPDPTQRLSPTPEIVSTFSLQSDHILGDPALALAALSYIVSKRMENANSENPSAPCPIIVHPSQLSQGKFSLAQFPEEAHCSTLPGNGSLGPHAASLGVDIPPNSGEFEVALIRNNILSIRLKSIPYYYYYYFKQAHAQHGTQHGA